MNTANRRVLVVAHGHPTFSKGGAELAASQMFHGFNARPGWEAWLLARHGERGLNRAGAAFQWLPGGREILMSSEADPFLFAAANLRYLTHDLPALLRDLRPDVVHLHHYVNLGVEWARVIKSQFPAMRVAMTLHEFLAICDNSGQMIKTSGELCERSSPAECHVCRPGRSPQDYFLRERYLRNFLESVDVFVAPSHFLKARYVAWGLPEARIRVIENGIPALAAAPAAEGSGRRFAYFGQITPFKGVDLLLQAWMALPETFRRDSSLSIFGGGHERFGGEFASRIERLLREAGVAHRPRYAPAELSSLMVQADWVVMPSIWWENSPLVIQEAFAHGRPVICAGIGGMAEKVRHERDGLHFAAGSLNSLRDTLRRAAEEPGLWPRLRAGIAVPHSIQQTLDDCERAYALSSG